MCTLVGNMASATPLSLQNRVTPISADVKSDTMAALSWGVRSGTTDCIRAAMLCFTWKDEGMINYEWAAGIRVTVDQKLLPLSSLYFVSAHSHWITILLPFPFSCSKQETERLEMRNFQLEVAANLVTPLSSWNSRSNQLTDVNFCKGSVLSTWRAYTLPTGENVTDIVASFCLQAVLAFAGEWSLYLRWLSVIKLSPTFLIEIREILRACLSRRYGTLRPLRREEFLFDSGFTPAVCCSPSWQSTCNLFLVFPSLPSSLILHFIFI